MFTEKFAALAAQTLDFAGETGVESLFTSTLTKFGETHALALQLQSAADSGDAEVLDVASGVLDLAAQFGKTFKNLSDDEQGQVRDVVARIVTGANQALVEGFFNAAFGFVVEGGRLKDQVDALLATVPPAEG